jgi:pimeloyl-ACP methyl ester carboxylesterase
VAQKIADPQRVAIMGASYGGYATLVGLTFTPDKFACSVDMVGISNLQMWLSTLPSYWEPWRQAYKDRIGDHTTPVPAAALAADPRRSHQAATVDRPGGQRRARQEYRVGPDRPALEARRIPVTYLSGSIRTMLSRTTDRHGSGRLLRTRDCATVRK